AGRRRGGLLRPSQRRHQRQRGRPARQVLNVHQVWLLGEGGRREVDPALERSIRVSPRGPARQAKPKRAGERALRSALLEFFQLMGPLRPLSASFIASADRSFLCCASIHWWPSPSRTTEVRAPKNCSEGGSSALAP